ncbi:uncharacterized protein JCM6883_006472 [Sporobolomyces salmoneus]|uniref:uncharacterized protein n=1 Tax=Sporobolomyces salmoneus TaxID=183962 RepID=UPI0031743008
MAAAADSTAQMAKANDATDSARIGWAFLSQYYSYLNKDPARLHCFYTKRSTLIHSTEGEDTVACYGQSEIHAKIMSLGFEDCKVYISNVDSQSSAEGGIIVQVIGEMSNSNGPWRKFAQTFFLAEQPNGYFVLNDICRYIKEEGDEELASAPVTAEKSTSTPPDEQPTSSTTTEGTTPASVGSVLFNDVKPVEEQEPEKKEEESTPVEAEPLQSSQEPNGHVNGDAVMAEPKEEEVEQKKEEVKEEEVKPVVVEPLSAVEHKSNEVSTPAVAEKEVEAPAPAPVEEVKKAEKEEEAPKPTSEVSSPPQASTSSAPAPPAPTPAQPVASPKQAPAPTPAAPTAPKSWASLAASGSATKWGSFSKAASVQKPAESATPSPAASSSNAQQASTSNAQAGGSSSQTQFSDQVQAVVQPTCFVKGVLEYVTEKQLREVLTTRFGPLKELDIIRSKACAFVEFINLNDARKAIQVSMRHQDGGENGIMFETPSGDKARINVVERKPHNERPPPKPRSNPTGESSTGGGGGGMKKDGQGQRNQGNRTGGQGPRNQGGRGQQQQGGAGAGARTAGGGGRQQAK